MGRRDGHPALGGLARIHQSQIVIFVVLLRLFSPFVMLGFVLWIFWLIVF